MKQKSSKCDLEQIVSWKSLVAQQNILKLTYTLTEEAKQSMLDKAKTSYMQTYGVAFDPNKKPNTPR